MSGPIRLVAIDVDGTLLDSAGAIRPRVERSVKDAIATGCRVILATGRRIQSAAPIARQLGISTVILVDGAVVYDLESSAALYERTLISARVQDAVRLVQNAGLPPLLFESPAARGRIFAGPIESDNPETAGFLVQRQEICRLPAEHLAGAARIVSVAGMGARADIDRLADLAREVRSLQAIRWNPSSSGYRTDVVGLTDPEISKGNALSWLAGFLGLATEETLAIGDYENDVSMIVAAGLGVAMGNAATSVKDVARAIVADNEHDGVAEALEKWVLV